MPTVSSTSSWRGVGATSASAGAALAYTRPTHTGEGNVINVSKEAAAHLRQRNAMTRYSDPETTTNQTEILRQTMIQSLLRYRGTGHDLESPEPELVRSSPLSHSAPTVFVVDEDVSVRKSIEVLVLRAGWRPETYGSGQEFLRRPRVPVPSCLILDISLPDLSGLELQKCLAVERPDTPIIFMTGRGGIAMTVQAMKGGALEFLTKPFADDVLLNVMRNALELSKIALHDDAEIRALRDRHASLSCRERQVMALVVRGLLNKQVADELGISEITVKAHRGRVMQKMAANSLPALVIMAARLGISVPKV